MQGRTQHALAAMSGTQTRLLTRFMQKYLNLREYQKHWRTFMNVIDLCLIRNNERFYTNGVQKPFLTIKWTIETAMSIEYKKNAEKVLNSRIETHASAAHHQIRTSSKEPFRYFLKAEFISVLKGRPWQYFYFNGLSKCSRTIVVMIIEISLKSLTKLLR